MHRHRGEGVCLGRCLELLKYDTDTRKVVQYGGLLANRISSNQVSSRP